MARKNPLREDFADLLDYAEQVAVFILPNLLWCLLAIPVVTIPAAAAGLFAVMSERARGQQPEVFAVFFGAMRRLWLPATIIALVDGLVGALIVVNLSLFPLMNITANPLAFLAWAVTLFVAFMLALINLYLWPLLVMVDAPLTELFKIAAQFAFAAPLWSSGILVLAALPVLISVILPQAFFVLVTFSAVAYIICRGTWQVIRQHLPPDRVSLFEAGHQPL